MSYFHPSRMALGVPAHKTDDTYCPKHRGDKSHPINSGENVPEDKNTNIWVLNLPAGTTHHNFLD